MNQPEVLLDMGVRGQELARELFDKNMLADKMLKAIEKIV
jgi:hypothetical protein